MENSNKTIGDEIALSIGSLGENMIMRRAVILNVKSNESLAWYMHGASKFFLINSIRTVLLRKILMFRICHIGCTIPNSQVYYF